MFFSAQKLKNTEVILTRSPYSKLSPCLSDTLNDLESLSEYFMKKADVS